MVYSDCEKFRSNCEDVLRNSILSLTKGTSAKQSNFFPISNKIDNAKTVLGFISEEFQKHPKVFMLPNTLS